MNCPTPRTSAVSMRLSASAPLAASLAICLGLLGACGNNRPSRPFDSGLDDGIVGIVTDAAGDPVAGAAVCLAFQIEFPDRFAKPATRISFDLPEAGAVTVKILDRRGDHVRVLVDGDLPAGSYAVTWDTRDDSGRLVPNGLYDVVVEPEAGESTHIGLLLSARDLETFFERANAVSDDEGYYRIPRDLIPVGATVPASTGEDGGGDVLNLIVSEVLIVEAARNTVAGVTCKSLVVTLALNQDRLVVDITLP